MLKPFDLLGIVPIEEIETINRAFKDFQVKNSEGKHWHISPNNNLKGIAFLALIKEALIYQEDENCPKNEFTETLKLFLTAVGYTNTDKLPL